ncbi:MauE/DoxX family redox-associated membrane protein [Intrasporangium sp. DVR]|uniref:MauE/DoxX family redox-associated membrane protein n=1 Tax=Intrasporangium sp. DVR TaxID=3127867 RepID=UPI00313A5D70
MSPTAIALAPVVLAAVLMIAAAGKLRAPSRSTEALVALDVPHWLRDRRLVTAHPWAEIVLALGLVLATGWLGTAFATGTAILFAGYLVLIARAARKPEPVDCDCFGALGAGRVTRATVARNIWYVLVAAAAVWAHAGGVSPVSVISSLGAHEWWWVAAAAAVALTVALTMHGQGSGAAAEMRAGDEDDLDEYVRTPTPAVLVKHADGTEVTLRDLSAGRAQLLLFVSRTCGWCSEVVDQTPEWRADLAELDVRLVYSQPSDNGADHETTLYDEKSWARLSCGVSSFPAAVALGRDGLLAGGPVTGHVAVAEFVEEIKQQLG